MAEGANSLSQEILLLENEQEDSQTKKHIQ